MPYFKDINNNIHFLDNMEDALKFLPSDCISIDEAEAELLRLAAIPVIPLSTLKIQAKIEIDQAAEAVRAKYLTPGSGQAMTYMKKVADAEKFTAALSAYTADQLLTPPLGVVDPETVLATTYPWVNSEVVAQGAITGQQAAAEILAQDAMLNSLGAQIEAIRRAGKIDVDAKIKDTTLAASKLATITSLQAL